LYLHAGCAYPKTIAVQIKSGVEIRREHRLQSIHYDQVTGVVQVYLLSVDHKLRETSRQTKRQFYFIRERRVVCIRHIKTRAACRADNVCEQLSAYSHVIVFQRAIHAENISARRVCNSDPLVTVGRNSFEVIILSADRRIHYIIIDHVLAVMRKLLRNCGNRN
jgi:hypothetical protein